MPWVTIISLGVAMGAFALFVGGKVVAAQRLGTATGSEGMIGSLATVRIPFAENGRGKVLLAGELWNAQLRSSSSDEATAPVSGDQVKVEAREGYTLVVSPAGGGCWELNCGELDAGVSQQGPTRSVSASRKH